MSLLANLFRLQVPTLTPNWCPTPPTWQTVLDKIGESQITLLLDIGNFQYNYGSTTPEVDNRLFPWLNTTTGLWYTFQNGMWITPHPVEAGSSFRTLWVGTETDLNLADGGANEPQDSPYTGPFWAIDHNWDDKIPIGVNTIAAAAGAESGASAVTLDSTNMPPHTHYLGLESGDLASDSQNGRLRDSDGNVTWQNTVATTAVGVTRSTGGSGTPATAQPFDIIPPVRGVWIVKRTARIWKTLPG